MGFQSFVHYINAKSYLHRTYYHAFQHLTWYCNKNVDLFSFSIKEQIDPLSAFQKPPELFIQIQHCLRERVALNRSYIYFPETFFAVEAERFSGSVYCDLKPLYYIIHLTNKCALV